MPLLSHLDHILLLYVWKMRMLSVGPMATALYRSIACTLIILLTKLYHYHSSLGPSLRSISYDTPSCCSKCGALSSVDRSLSL